MRQKNEERNSSTCDCKLEFPRCIQCLRTAVFRHEQRQRSKMEIGAASVAMARDLVTTAKTTIPDEFASARRRRRRRRRRGGIALSSHHQHATEGGPTGLATVVLKCFYYKKSLMYFTFGPRTASTVIQRFVSNLSSE